jgi:outer membrane protein assembly factor BamB
MISITTRMTTRSVWLMAGCTSLLLLLSEPRALRAENWPQWRGPSNNGISSERSIATDWSLTENIVWKTKMPGQAGATPIVWGDRIFLTSADGDDLVLICLDAKTGAEHWRKLVASGNQDARAGEGNSASPSPSTDGKHVWVFFSTGVLACYDFDGNQVWMLDCNQQFGKLDIQFGMTSTPVLDGDALYLQLLHGPMDHASDHRTGKVIKLNKLTGKVIWEYDRITDAVFECKHSYASPFLYDDGKKRYLLVHGADCTTAHALDSGKEIWRLGGLNGPSTINSRAMDVTFRFVSSPAFAAGRLIIPTAKAGPTISLDLSADPKGDLTEKPEMIAWTVEQTPDVSIPLIVDDLVYLLHKDGKLQCVELKTGQEVYFERTHTVQHRTSPVYADGHIYFCGKDGVCTVVKAGRKFQIVASNPMGEQPITASPVISNGTLYIRTYEALYAIRKP